MSIFDFFDRLFGISDTGKIEKCKNRGNADGIFPFVEAEDRRTREKALAYLESLARMDSTPPEIRESIINRLTPINRLKERLELEKTEDPRELNSIAVNRLLPSGDMEMAVFALEQALKISPGDPSLLNNLGGVHLVRGHNEKAAQIWKSILENTNHPGAKENLICSYLDQAKQHTEIPQKIETYNEILKIDPMETRALYELAIILKENNENEKAVDLLLKCLESEPVPPRFRNPIEFWECLYENLGELFGKLNNNSESEKYSGYAAKLRIKPPKNRVGGSHPADDGLSTRRE